MALAIPDTGVDADWVLGWLGELVEETCPRPPVLVGRTIGGAIAARFAADRPGSLTHLVLVDALGLSAFEPAPRFGLAMQRFLSQPTAGTYDRSWTSAPLTWIWCASMGSAGRPTRPTPSNWPAHPRAGRHGRFDRAVRGDTDPAGGTGPHQRSHHLDLAGTTSPPQSRSPRRSEPGTAGRCTSSRTPVTTRPEQPAAFLAALRAAIGTLTADPITEAVAS